jgi:hypothetical protein
MRTHGLQSRVIRRSEDGVGIHAIFITISVARVRVAAYVVRGTPLRMSDVWAILCPGNKTMKTMLKTIYTSTFAEAAQAALVPCRHLPVNDGRRLESAFTLAERCAR